MERASSKHPDRVAIASGIGIPFDEAGRRGILAPRAPRAGGRGVMCHVMWGRRWRRDVIPTAQLARGG